MTYKSKMCYVVMRQTFDPHDKWNGTSSDFVPVAVFYDEETASGNAEGYNLEFKERNVDGVYFYVAVTMAYE